MYQVVNPIQLKHHATFDRMLLSVQQIIFQILVI